MRTGGCPGDGAWCPAALFRRPSPGARGEPARGPRVCVRRPRPACIYSTSACSLFSQGTPAAELRPRGRGPEEEEGAPSQTSGRSVSGAPASLPRGTVGCLHPSLARSGGVTGSARTGFGPLGPSATILWQMRGRAGGQHVRLQGGGRAGSWAEGWKWPRDPRRVRVRDPDSGPAISVPESSGRATAHRDGGVAVAEHGGWGQVFLPVG